MRRWERKPDRLRSRELDELQLPIAVTLAKDLPAKLTLTPQLPQLRGTSKSSFEYQLGIKNDSGKKLTVSLSAQAPQNFDASFTEQYGSQELNAVPVDAGQSKDVKLKVTPPNTAAAGDYKVDGTRARRGCLGDIRSRPRHYRPAEARCQRSRRPGVHPRLRRQGDAVPVVITNTGTAPADDIELSGSAPSGWKVTFDPKTVDRIAPNENKEVQALITPTDKAIAGDYVTTIRASARGESASTTFRVTVTTSTMWVSPASASSASRFSSWSGRWQGSAGDERGCCHRGQRPHQEVWSGGRRRSHFVYRRARRDFRTARPERRGQDDDDPDDARAHRHFGGRGAACSGSIRRASRSRSSVGSAICPIRSASTTSSPPRIICATPRG